MRLVLGGAAAAAAVVAASVFAADSRAIAPGANGRIFYESRGSSAYNIWSVNPDGTAPTQLTTQPSNAVGAHRPSVSGDGSKVAYMQFDDTHLNSSQIWVMNGNGSGQTQLTTTGDSIENFEPGISPDGSKVVFQRANVSGSATGQDLWIMNANGTGQTQLAGSTDDEKSPEFSPDGTKIVYVRATGSNQIWLMNANGSNQHVLLNNPGVQDTGPSWSPDGKKIVYEDGTNGLSVMNADGSNPTPIHNGSGQAIPAQDPTWSPDGMKIAFYFVPGAAGSEGIFTVPATGGANPHEVINLPTDFQSVYPSWAAGSAVNLPPDTRLAKPKISSRKRTATFTFVAVGTATHFQCALAHKHARLAFSPCASPKRYRHLKPGSYTFEVEALNGSTPDPTPAKKKFTIRR